MKITMLRSILFACCLAPIAAPAMAGVIINGTRVVYPQGEGEVTVRLANKGEKPALVQAWLDDGDANSTPDTSRVPFLLTPPIFRMEGGKGQSLRMTYTNEPLPADRESLFWLNVLDIPPKSEKDPGDSTLQFAFRTRIKVFYRPKGLAIDVSAAPEALKWQIKQAGGSAALVVNNPTPYHMTVSNAAVVADGKEYPQKEESAGMVAPFQSMTIPLAAVPATTGQEVKFTSINDYGANAEHRASLQH